MNNRRLGAGLGLALGCLLFVAPPRCEAQNLVPNHSFEEYDTCRVVNDVYYPDTGPLGWFSAGWTPDHFMSCLPYGSFNGVPLNYFTFQHPQEGEAYAGVITYDQAFGGREYLMVQLLSPLVQGQTYYASFHANAAWGGIEPQVWLASSHVGMLFTTQQRQWEYNDPVPAPGNFAHVYRPSILADTVGWTLVSGSFVADSAYRYLMIGNHFDNATTDTLHFANFNWNPRGHTLIDNVCVSPNPDGCPLATGAIGHSMDAVLLFPNPADKELTVHGLAPGTQGRINDAMGRQVWRGVPTAEVWTLDVSMWARGAYVLCVEGQGEQKSFRFVLIE